MAKTIEYLTRVDDEQQQEATRRKDLEYALQEESKDSPSMQGMEHSGRLIRAYCRKKLTFIGRRRLGITREQARTGFAETEKKIASTTKNFDSKDLANFTAGLNSAGKMITALTISRIEGLIIKGKTVGSPTFQMAQAADIFLGDLNYINAKKPPKSPQQK